MYHGLTVGKSTRKDVLRVLGHPESQGIAADTDDVPFLAYRVGDPVKGRLEVYFSRLVVSSMALDPDTPLSKADVIRIFGNSYLQVRYSTDPCGKDTNEGTSEMYEDPTGDVKHLEYRDRGIAVYFHLTEGTEILYVHEPFGPAHSRCVEIEKKTRK